MRKIENIINNKSIEIEDKLNFLFKEEIKDVWEEWDDISLLESFFENIMKNGKMTIPEKVKFCKKHEDLNYYFHKYYRSFDLDNISRFAKIYINNILNSYEYIGIPSFFVYEKQGKQGKATDFTKIEEAVEFFLSKVNDAKEFMSLGYNSSKACKDVLNNFFEDENGSPYLKY